MFITLEWYSVFEKLKIFRTDMVYDHNKTVEYFFTEC